jgi:peroxiredoxin
MFIFMRRQTWKAGFLAFWILLFGCGGDGDKNPMAPEFQLPDLSGQIKSLSEYRDHLVILDFWATWCPPCRMSIPELVSLQKAYQDQGLVVLGISLDRPQTSNRFLQAFKKKFNINYPILRYNETVIRDYFATETPAVPTMFIVDGEGRIRKKLVGFRPGALKEALNGLLP